MLHCNRNFFLLCSSIFLLFNIIPSCLSLSPWDKRNNLFPLSSEYMAFFFLPSQLVQPLNDFFAAVLGIPFNLSTYISRFEVQSHHCHTARKSSPRGQRNEDSARTDPNHNMPFCHSLVFQHTCILFAVF